MKIVADQNIPEVKHAFASHGDVELVNGRDLSAQQLVNADALVVRSVTRVNADLLQNSRIKFVGSATIGTDHVDLDYLHKNNIAFANAPGCNATSAAEYVLAAALHVAELNSLLLPDLKVGVVGYGNVGSRVSKKFMALGCKVVVYDPPREQQYHDCEYCSWNEITECDIVTAHVPLTRGGDYPTYRMFDNAFFTALKEHAVFINTSRGGAVDEAALKQRMKSGRSVSLVLDVWQNEPDIDLALLQQTVIATPHIAGYSREGKFRGLQMVYQAACNFFHWQPVWAMEKILPVLDKELELAAVTDLQKSVHMLVQQAYSIIDDDKALRKILDMPVAERAEYFDGLRKNYPERREFFNYQFRQTGDNKVICNIAEGLGFSVLR
jgi:erythronate-4-phosphate dehydrogenase